jgi:3-dehydroquinate synthase
MQDFPKNSELIMQIALTKHGCKIVIAQDGFAGLSPHLTSKLETHSSCMIVSDDIVYGLYGEQLLQLVKAKGIPVHRVIFSSGEQAKTLDTAQHCWAEMHAQGLDRKSLVIGLGGGVVTDIAGFVAACYMRGLDVVHVPTTLLGMVDASIGGKTGINLPYGKNYVGAMHHPKFVLISAHYLETLPDREFRAGLAEVIKYGIIWDPELFEFIQKNMKSILQKDKKKLDTIVRQSCAIKAQVVKQEEKEPGLRSIVNFGHTFAHAIESAMAYKGCLHGEAVAIGMCCAAHVSHALGLIDKAVIKQIEDLCALAGLPTTLPDLSIDTLLQLMQRDKKAVAGKISLIVVQKIGKVIQMADVDKEVIREALVKTS